MKIDEAMKWYGKIRRTCAYPMYVGWAVIVLGFILDIFYIRLIGIGITGTAIAILVLLLRGMSGEDDGGERKRKTQQPPEVPAK